MKVPADVMRFLAPKVPVMADTRVVQSSKEHSKRYIYISVSGMHAIWRSSDHLVIVMRLRRVKAELTTKVDPLKLESETEAEKNKVGENLLLLI